jgi:hypothetical protein
VYLFLQKSAIDKIQAEIKTPKGKQSLTLEIKHYYILHRLNYYYVLRKEAYIKGIPFSSKVLTDLFGRSSDVKNVMRYLISNCLIKKVRYHIAGQSSALYKLHPSIEGQQLYQIDYSATDSALIKALEMRSDDTKCFKKQLTIMQNKVSLNSAGIAYLKNKYGVLPLSDGILAVDPMDIGLTQIFYRRFFASRPDIKSRVYTNITSLSRNHRQYISFDGQPMLMTDISNSQILLTVPLLHKFWAKKSGRGLLTLPADVNRFQTLAETGKFYEHIAKSVGKIFKNEDERSQFKREVFANIWFSKNSKRKNAIKTAFQDEFPTVYDIIWQLKAERHNEFAIKLQQFEASIMVDKVWMKMVKMNKSVLTLHDAIICSNFEDLELAEKLIDDAMVKFRLAPKFKRDYVELKSAI